MAITLELGTIPAINVALEVYLLDCRKNKRKVDDTVINTSTAIITDVRLQRYWIEKFINKK